jgi:cell division protein FtsQ
MIRTVLGFIAVLLLLAGSSYLWQRLDQPVRTVRVEGALSNVEQAAIREVCAESLHAGVLSMDLDELTDRIYDLGWPREVRVRRVWPGGLVIQVEREPLVAAWGREGFLTSAGKVVHLPGHTEQQVLPVLSAALSTPRQTMQTYQMLQDPLGESGLKISALEENLLGEWVLTLDNGITVALGHQAITDRLQRFLLIYRKVLVDRMPELAHVDTRYENGVAVRWGEAMLAYEKTQQQPQLDPRTRNGF